MIPTLVTGALSQNAKRVQSGTRRGIKYEIWFDPTPHYRSGGAASPRRPYGAVVWYPYIGMDGSRGVEVEQIAWSATQAAAVGQADEYIERIWKRDRRDVMRGEPSLLSNPITTENVVMGAAIIGGLAAFIGLVKSL